MVVSDADEGIDDTPLIKMDAKEDIDYKPPPQNTAEPIVGTTIATKRSRR